MGDHEERVLYGSELHYNIIIINDGWMDAGYYRKRSCVYIIVIIIPAWSTNNRF